MGARSKKGKTEKGEEKRKSSLAGSSRQGDEYVNVAPLMH